MGMRCHSIWCLESMRQNAARPQYKTKSQLSRQMSPEERIKDALVRFSAQIIKYSRQQLRGHCGWDELQSYSALGQDIEPLLSIEATLGNGSLGLVEEIKSLDGNKLSFVRKRVFISRSRRKQLQKIVSLAVQKFHPQILEESDI